MEDFLFSLECLEHCKRVYMLSKALYHYHQSEDEGNVYRRIKKIGSLSEYVNMVVRLSLQRHFSHHDAPGGLPGIQHCSRGADGEHTNPECK